MILNKLIEEL